MWIAKSEEIENLILTIFNEFDIRFLPGIGICNLLRLFYYSFHLLDFD